MSQSLAVHTILLPESCMSRRSEARRQKRQLRSMEVRLASASRADVYPGAGRPTTRRPCPRVWGSQPIPESTPADGRLPVEDTYSVPSTFSLLFSFLASKTCSTEIDGRTRTHGPRCLEVSEIEMLRSHAHLSAPTRPTGTPSQARPSSPSEHRTVEMGPSGWHRHHYHLSHADV